MSGPSRQILSSRMPPQLKRGHQPLSRSIPVHQELTIFTSTKSFSLRVGLETANPRSLRHIPAIPNSPRLSERGRFRHRLIPSLPFVDLGLCRRQSPATSTSRNGKVSLQLH